MKQYSTNEPLPMYSNQFDLEINRDKYHTITLPLNDRATNRGNENSLTVIVRVTVGISMPINGRNKTHSTKGTDIRLATPTIFVSCSFSMRPKNIKETNIKAC